MKNSGRPRKDGFNTIIKFTVDDKSAENINNVSSLCGKSTSDVMRELLPIISSKDFEGMLPKISMRRLEYYSKSCWEILHMTGYAFEVAEFSKNMPAFITTWNPPMVHVKYPTYKIQIFHSQDHTKYTEFSHLDQILSKIPNISKVYKSPANYIANGTCIQKLEYPFVSEVTCLAIELSDNTKAKDDIIQCLTQNNYDCVVYPSYCIRSDYIEFIDDKKYFKIKN